MIGGLSVLDLVLLALLIGYAVSGYRRGLVVSLFSLVGFLSGAALGMWLLPLLFRAWQAEGESLQRTLVLVVGVFLVATICQGIGATLGSRLRSALRLRPARALDSLLGVVAVTAAVCVLVWFVGAAVRSAAPPSLAKAIGESRVLRVIDGAVPPQTSRLFAGFRSVLDREGFPKVFEGVQVEPIAPVSPPQAGLTGGAAVSRAASSVVKITGVAASCDRAQEGSGWVAARDRVVTNAHVVAGVRVPRVQVGGTGPAYRAVVVVFDPRRDLAVLDVPGLPAAPLPRGGVLKRGDGAVVAGFPQDGPYRLDAARVRQQLSAVGADIYGSEGVRRDIYSLYTTVEPGNSGGPLLSTEGKVVGVVFAKSLDDDTTGYALTLREAQPVLARVGRTTGVSTGACAAG